MKDTNKFDRAIIHVYYGTADNAGSYMNQTIMALRKLHCNTIAFVNAYYVFEDKECHKVFFKRTELMKRNKFRKYYKYVEMICNFHTVQKKIIKYAQKYKEVFIVYSLNECYKPVFDFLDKIKKTENVKIGILVHDVVPFKTTYSKWIYVSQDRILELADYFVAHNRYTTDILMERFSGRKILQYRFPLLDLSQMPKMKLLERRDDEKITFLFLGYLRIEKGIEILLDAWEKIEKEYEQAHLIIAGKIPEGVEYDFSKCKHIEQIEKYLNDEEYSEVIQRADYGVLPYIEGTNSGVLSTISCYRRPSITSDLPMFQESYFAIPELSFITGDANDLARLMSVLIEQHSEVYPKYQKIMDNKIKDYKSLFAQEVVKEYGEKLLGQFI